MENNRIEKHKEERKRMEWNGMEQNKNRFKYLMCFTGKYYF